MSGILYIVATPIGNLGDISARAIEVLKSVDLIAAEDTRHSKPLLQQFSIDTRLIAYHDHNEASQSQYLLAKLGQGESIALISDAGTPLISDPGYSLVHLAQEQDITVVPIPGACALIAALSASGLPTDKFYFSGFLPVKATAREKRLAQLVDLKATFIFYESPRRIIDCLTSMSSVFEADCQCVIAREISKKFETFYVGTIAEVLQQLINHPEQHRGEFVVMLHQTKSETEDGISLEAKKTLTILLAELSVKQAANLTAKITGEKKNILYNWALKQQ